MTKTIGCPIILVHMPRETPGTYKPDKDEAKFYKDLEHRGIPSINRALKRHIDGIDQDKFITTVSIMGGSTNTLLEETRAKKPIRNTFPYFDELVSLGIKPETIEGEFYQVSEEKPYDRDTLHNPGLLRVPKSFPRFFQYPAAGVTTTIIMLDILGAPKPKEVEDPQVKEVARRMLRKHAIDTLLRKFIAQSGADFEDPKFDSVKMRIQQDLDAQTTRFFFFGAQILGVLEGQELDKGTFMSGDELHENIAFLLAKPVLETVLIDFKTNLIDQNGLMHEFKRKAPNAVTTINEETGLDLSTQWSATKGETTDDYRDLASLYLNSQIPLLVAMGSAF